MKRTLAFTCLLMCLDVIAAAETIVCPSDAPPLVRLAAKEVRRYVYLRTGELPAIAPAGTGLVLRVDASLAPQEFRITPDGIAGGSEVGALYGAYRYAELLGVRFYLHGDVVPDERLNGLPAVTDSGKPLFALRGINPWGYHPFGMDAWSADDYMAVFSQLAKMRMNFVGVHCYPEGHPQAEPTVWHGLAGDFDARGQVQRSYVTRYFNTVNSSQWGGYQPKKTSDYRLGGALLFDDEAWAPDVMRGNCPLPATPEACNEVFNRMGDQFRDAFSFARALGVKTCLGTEAPLIMPKNLALRTKDVRAVYEGTFRRIMASHPLDYYWIWTPEGWTWEGNNPAQYSNTVADIRLAIDAAKNVGAPFRLATCGWVLGPQHDRAAFDRDLPRDIPMSAISRSTGATEVDPAFGRIDGRETWAIPWLESDNREGLAGIQLFAGRMRRDAADARAYGCTGLMGLQWRTEILSPNVSALAQAAWDQRWDEVTAAWNVPGQMANYPNAAIKGTEDAPLYRSCRYDLGTIRARVPPGRCKVTLKFCEPHFDAAGQRVCDVRIQGRTVLTNLDIFARVGKFAALDFAFDDIDAGDGAMTVDLVARTSLPCISAIAVEGKGFTNRINLGGGAYEDWQADAGKARYAPVEDFYADWAQANFGLADAGRIFSAIDGKVPQVTDGGCPSGSLKPDARPWSAVAPQFAFIDELDALRPRIHGDGNLSRLDYWLHSFRYLRALAEVRCAMGAKQPEEVRRGWTEAYTHLLATVNSPGALATVVNMEGHPGWGATVAAHGAGDVPADYRGTPRLVVPTVRSVVATGESLSLKIITLTRELPAAVVVRVRPLGGADWQAIQALHVARGVFQAKLPPAVADFEYHVTAGDGLVWPATAPQMNQTVVVMD